MARLTQHLVFGVLNFTFENPGENSLSFSRNFIFYLNTFKGMSYRSYSQRILIFCEHMRRSEDEQYTTAFLSTFYVSFEG